MLYIWFAFRHLFYIFDKMWARFRRFLLQSERVHKYLLLLLVLLSLLLFSVHRNKFDFKSSVPYKIFAFKGGPHYGLILFKDYEYQRTRKQRKTPWLRPNLGLNYLFAICGPKRTAKTANSKGKRYLYETGNRR